MLRFVEHPFTRLLDYSTCNTYNFYLLLFCQQKTHTCHVFEGVIGLGTINMIVKIVSNV
jgi:hypothetical protein